MNLICKSETHEHVKTALIKFNPVFDITIPPYLWFKNFVTEFSWNDNGRPYAKKQVSTDLLHFVNACILCSSET